MSIKELNYWATHKGGYWPLLQNASTNWNWWQLWSSPGNSQISLRFGFLRAASPDFVDVSVHSFTADHCTEEPVSSTVPVMCLLAHFQTAVNYDTVWCFPFHIRGRLILSPIKSALWIISQEVFFFFITKSIYLITSLHFQRFLFPSFPLGLCIF